MRVLTARGSELEREFPFGVVRQLFEPPLKRARAFAALGAEVRRARLLAETFAPSSTPPERGRARPPWTVLSR